MASSMPTLSLTLTYANGTTTPIPLAELASYTTTALRISINYGAQLGASLLLLAVLLLTTSRDKRRAPLFALTALALAANAARLLLGCLYFTGPFYAPPAFFARDFAAVTAPATAAQVAALPLVLLVHACVCAALLIQVRALSATLPPVQRAALGACSVLVALAACTVRFALMVVNARAIVAAQPMTRYLPLIKANLYTTTISFIFFALLFLAKLGVAIHRRRRLRLAQFGPLQILFIGACQTLFLPALFAILQLVTDVPEMGSLVLSSVALSLPLTSLWAAASVDRPLARGGGGGAAGPGRGAIAASPEPLTGSSCVESELSTATTDRKSFLEAVWTRKGSEEGAESV